MKKKIDHEKTVERSRQVKMFSNDETPRDDQNKGCVGVQRKPSEVGMYIRGTGNGVPQWYIENQAKLVCLSVVPLLVYLS